MTVLNLGKRLYTIGRITEGNKDLAREDETLIAERYIPDQAVSNITTSDVELVQSEVMSGNEVSVWLIGACVQQVVITTEDGHDVKLLGVDPLNTKQTITMSDMYALYSYQLNDA